MTPTSGWCGPSTCPPVAPTSRSPSPATPRRLGLRLRRGAHGRQRRLDDPCPTRTATRPMTPGTLPAVAGHAPVHLRPLHDGRPGRRGLHAHQRGRRVVGRQRRSDGPEQWQVDLTPYAGSTVELSISYASDFAVQHNGVFVDDIAVSTGEGSTSFESGFDGWTVPGRAARAAPATTTTGSSAPPPTCRHRRGSSPRRRSPGSRRSSGSKPASSGATRGGRRAGSSTTSRGSGLPWRTRRVPSTARTSSPTRSPATGWSSTSSPTSGTATAWPCIAGRRSGSTRASRRTPSGCGRRAKGSRTEQENFDFFYEDFIAPDDPWWDIIIGDPGPGPALRVPRLLPRRHDPAPAAADGRRPGLLPDPPDVGRSRGPGTT